MEETNQHQSVLLIPLRNCVRLHFIHCRYVVSFNAILFLFYIDPTLLEQVIGTLRGVRNIKQLNLLTTKQTRKLDLSIVCLINKADAHQALQVAANLCLQYLVPKFYV